MSRILITGSSKGIGRATATELARRGHTVVATARKVEALKDLDVAVKLPLDVTDDASVAKAVVEAGPIDVLINNAGDIAFAPLETIPFAEVRNLYELNVFGTLRTIQAFAPQMRERGSGTIANMSSVVGRIALPLTGIYCSTKWAIEGMSESLRLELGHFGVRVILLEPGQVGTTAFDAPRTYYPEGGPYAPLVEERKMPVREKLTPPEEIARAIADAVESTDDTFRFPAGADAKALIGARKQLDDRAFEAQLRTSLKLTW